jgi:hypothetical protein
MWARKTIHRVHSSNNGNGSVLSHSANKKDISQTREQHKDCHFLPRHETTNQAAAEMQIAYIYGKRATLLVSTGATTAFDTSEAKRTKTRVSFCSLIARHLLLCRASRSGAKWICLDSTVKQLRAYLGTKSIPHLLWSICLLQSHQNRGLEMY